MDETRLAGHCPRCGRKLPTDAPEGLCASCLFGAAAETLTQTVMSTGADADAPTILAASVPTSSAGDGPRLPEGHLLGPYRIGRMLGRGGMGEVYEAEHQENGRRLALKVLRARLQDSEDRARFLYEGRLAASVSHPHTVYIYGSEEISGLSLITMELLPGGTLKDLVASRGPLSPHEAVSAVLDLIGGLDAAQGAGILHRDIKPSNCFVDIDGAVKVGDFGLSISTLARDASLGTSTGFQGTPQFAAPEQLLGRPLDVRADIYAVGATLFYLLTGEAPFDARDLRELVARVTTEAPRSPRVLQPRIPQALAQVVLECLAKEPAARPATYAELADALRPFSASTAQPARMGLRIAAGLVDSLLLAIPFSIQSAFTLRPVRQGMQFTADPLMSSIAITVGILYYLTLEIRWSASLGKLLTGLRVVGDAGMARPGQILERTLMFYAPALPALAILLIAGEQSLTAFLGARPALAALFSISTLLLSAALFSTMRRANGWAAVHDLVSGTRVVMRPRDDGHERLDLPATPLGDAASIGRVSCGPFEVTGDLGATDTGRLLAAFDPILRRRVWIHAVPSGTPPIDPARRDVNRAGRLHWLAGRRGASENWDAFEAPDGASLTAMTAGKHTWRHVRGWLADLARELAASERQGSLPALRLSRVWIRADGRPLLLDLPAPSSLASSRTQDERELSPTGLLSAVATHGLAAVAAGASKDATPLSARALLARWRATPSIPIDTAVKDLSAVAGTPDYVQRWRRTMTVGVLALPIILSFVGAFAAVPAFRAMTTPERYEVYSLLSILNATEGRATATRSRTTLDAMEVYLAGRHRQTLEDPAAFGSKVVSTEFAKLAPEARRVSERHPNVSPESLAAARAAIVTDLSRIDAAYAKQSAQTSGAIVVMIVLLVTIAGVFSMACGLISAAAVPGGVLNRMLGLAAVDRDGIEITRLRSIGRWLIAWSPFVPWVVWILMTPIRSLSEVVSPMVPLGVILVVMAAGAIWTIVRPARALQDRLAGVWIVPR